MQFVAVVEKIRGKISGKLIILASCTNLNSTECSHLCDCGCCSNITSNMHRHNAAHDNGCDANNQTLTVGFALTADYLTPSRFHTRIFRLDPPSQHGDIISPYGI